MKQQTHGLTQKGSEYLKHIEKTNKEFELETKDKAKIVQNSKKITYIVCVSTASLLISILSFIIALIK